MTEPRGKIIVPVIDGEHRYVETTEDVGDAMALILAFIRKNGFRHFFLGDRGERQLIRRRSEEELVAIEEANKIHRESVGDDFPRKPKKGHIYLVGSETEYHKIGRAKQLDQRIQTFNVKIPFKTWLVHSFVSNDYLNAEKELHNRFSNKRSHGEWFKLDDKDIEYICAIQDGQL